MGCRLARISMWAQNCLTGYQIPEPIRLGDAMNIDKLRDEAANGQVASQTILGICYLDGYEVEVNYQEAFRLLSAASARGVPRAMGNLARIYCEGLGVAKDLSEAVRLYERAAKAGEFDAQIALGRIYSGGVDAALANPDEALAWYSRALAQANSVAECRELQEARAYVDGAPGGPSPASRQS
jgi:TPR repeat protein